MGQVTVEVGEKTSHESHENVTVFVGPHVLQFADADIGRAETKHVCPFDGAPYPALGNHLQHPGVDEPGHVAVKTGCRHIGQFGAEGARCQGSVSEESLDYPQPDRVQQQLSRRHPTTLTRQYQHC